APCSPPCPLSPWWWVSWAAASSATGWANTRGSMSGGGTFGAFTLFLTGVFLIIGSRAQDTTLAVVVLAGGAGVCYLGQATYWAVAADYGGALPRAVFRPGHIGGDVTGGITPL